MRIYLMEIAFVVTSCMLLPHVEVHTNQITFNIYGNKMAYMYCLYSLM